MAVALQSLRVTSEMDATGYARGAAVKVAADAQMIESDKARNSALAQAQAAMDKAIPGFNTLAKSLLQGYSAGQTFEAQIRKIGNSVDQGLGLDKATLLLESLYRKFDLVADASVLARQGFVSIVPAVNDLNKAVETYNQTVQRADLVTRAFADAKKLLATQAANQQDINSTLGVNLAGNSGDAQASADAFLGGVGGLAGVAKAKAEQVGRAFTEELNSRLVQGITSSARGSAEAFSEMFSQMDAIAAARAHHFAEQVQLGWSQAFNMTGAGVKSAKDSASVFQEVYAAEEAAAKAAADLRAQINPLEAEFVTLGKQMAQYRQLLKEQVISSTEFEQANAIAAKRLSDVDLNLRKAATGGRVLSGEMANLGYQVNDVLTGVLLGQSPFMILAQQGGQIYQIFSHSKAGIADFASSAASSFTNFLTVGRVAFGGVALSIGTALLALNSYLSAQQKVSLGLTGSGRGSGLNVAGVNAIAQQGASPFGLSVSEATKFATALATTGKIATDTILPIVQMGKDIQRVYGIDATEAAKMLADAFADPVKGADQLNDRLGFLDAGMKRNIENLVAQNRVWEAQRVLLSGVKSGLEGVDEATRTHSKGWTAVGNAISNAYEGLGEYVAKGLGLSETLHDRVLRAKSDLEALKAGQQTTAVTDISYGLGPNTPASAGTLKAASDRYDALAKAEMNVANAADIARAAQQSFLQEATTRSLTPEIAEQEKLNNDLITLQTLFKSLATDDGAGARIAKLGVTMEQLSQATTVASDKAARFKSEYDLAASSLQIANQAITAFSAEQKGDIAYQQSMESTIKSNFTNVQRLALANQSYANAVKQVKTALEEAARARELTANQAVASAQLDLSLVGKSIEQQALQKANLSVRQQLEQEASVNRSKFDTAQFEALKKINAETAKQLQLAAEAGAKASAGFDLETVSLTEVEKQVAQIQNRLHGDEWKNWTNDALSGTLRLTAALKTVLDTLPEVQRRKQLAEAASQTGAISEDPVGQKAIEITQAQADRAKAINKQLRDDFKTTFEAMQISAKTTLDAVTAFSPAAKAAIAQRQALEAVRQTKDLSPEEKIKAGQDAYTLSIKQSITALSEAARVRLLTAKQSVDSAQLDIDLIGKSIGEQDRLKADLSSRQQLEQEASQNRTAFDNAQYQRLQKTNAVLGQKKQIEAEASAQDKANFDLQTVFLSQIDQQIAAVQKQLHGNQWPKFMDDGLAATMRLADSFKFLKDAAETFASSFVKDLVNGVPAVQALQNALKTLASTLIDSAVKKLVDTALSGLTSALTSAAGGAVAGGAQAATMSAGASTAAAILTTAGTTVAASIIAGATEAAGILGLTIPPAAATLPVAGAAAGTEVAVGGAAAGGALAAGGAAAGAALWGPIALLVAAAAAIGLGSFLGGGNDQQAQALKQAQDAWHGMTQQVVDFNRAASGFKLGALTSELNQLYQSLVTVAEAANKAHDYAAVASLQNTFNQGLIRIVNEFVNGAQNASDLAQKLQGVRDEGAGLVQTLKQLGVYSEAWGTAIDQGVTRRLDEIRKATEADLQKDINAAQGLSYLNDLSDAVAKFNDLIANGIDPNLATTWLKATAQKIVNDANLTGQALTDITNKFPILANVVVEASAAIARSAQDIASARQDYQDQLFNLQQDQTTLAGQLAVFDRKAEEDRAAEIAKGGQALVDLEALQAAQRLDIVQKFNDQQLQAAQQAADQFKSFLTQFTNTIRTYLDGLTAGSGSPLSPQARLAAAQSQYNTQLALAQGGDQTAAGNITQYASNLIDAAKAYYASSVGFQTIFGQIQSQLGALPDQVSATQQVINAITAQTTALQAAFASGSASAIAAALLPQFNQLTANTNGLLSFSQFQTIAGGLADTATLHSIFNTLDTDGNGQIDRLEAIKGSTSKTDTNTKNSADNILALTTNISATSSYQAQLLQDILASVNGAYNFQGTNLPYLATISANSGFLSLINGALGTTNVYLGAMRQMMQQQNAHWGQQGGSGIPFYASGTDFAPGGWSIVGERGPELVNLTRGAQVLPNHRVALNDNGGAMAALVAEVRAMQRHIANLEAALRQVGDRIVNVTAAGAEHVGGKIDVVAKHSQTTAKAARRVA